MSTRITNAQNAAAIAELTVAVQSLQALIAANLQADAPAAPAVEATDKWAEIAAHVQAKRVVRRESTKLGGLTKVERKALAAANREVLAAASKKSRAAYDRKWASLVKAHKAATV